MMEEKEIINKLKELRKIKPEKNWVFLTKRKILGKEEMALFPIGKIIFIFLLIIGIFSASQLSLLREPLYYIKKISQETQKTFLSEKEKPQASLDLANEKLEEIKKITQKKDIKKITPAIEEFKVTISKTKEDLVKLKGINKEIAQKVLKLEEKKKEVEKVLGIKLTQEEEDPSKIVAEYLIKNFERNFLTEEKAEILEKVKQYFQNGEYGKVIEILISLNNMIE